MALRVTLAGRVGIEVDGGEVPAGGLGRPGRLALAYLVCERHRVVSRDELAEVLWGEELPRSYDQMLRGIALKLRAVLAATGLDPALALTTTAGAFRLQLPADATVDTEEATASLEAAEASLAAGYAGAARARAQAAVTTAARQFAPTTAGVWVERRQAELADLHLRALEALARAALAEGDWAAAISAAEDAIARQPLRESAYVSLMDAHARAGNRGEALRAYERCRTVLVEELGVDPSPPTTAAYLRLLGDEPAPPEPAAAALPLPAGVGPTPESFVVGRASELEVLEAAVKRAGVEGRQGVVVGGEPGAGKTTLVSTAARAAHAQGARVLYGRADEKLALAYGPFAQALGHYVATAPAAELRAHLAACGPTLARLVPELTRRLPEAKPPPPTDAETDRWALFEAVADVLGRAAAETTVVVVLDDLHWAAPHTLDLLHHLLAEPRPAAVVVVATYRSTEPTAVLASTLADLRRAPAVERVALGGLDPEGVAAFVAAATGDHDDGALARALHAHTAGNPFFVGQLLRHLTETGATYRRAGPWSYYADAQGLDVPEGVGEVVTRRLGRLSPEANAALVLASVAGTHFDLDVLEGAATAPDTVLDGLDEAQRAALVVELDRPGRYRFAHALVRDAIYATLSGARRARLHLRIGHALEALPGDDAERLAALAHHFAEAASAGGAAKAADYALAAGEQALGQGAAESAVALLERGLRALGDRQPPDLERTSDLLLALARTHLFADDASARYKAAMEAYRVARQLGSPERLAEAVCAVVPVVKAVPDFLALVEEALANLGDGFPRLRSFLLGYLALGRRPSDAADRASEESLALARATGDPATLGPALLMRARVLIGSPRAADLLDVTEELVAAAPAGAWHGWRHGHRLRAVARLMNGDRAGFDADVDELERRGRQASQWLDAGNAARYRVTQAFIDGRFDEVEALVQTGAARLRDEVEADTYRMFSLARLHLERGRIDDAAAVIAPGIERSPEGRPPYLFAMLALVELDHGLGDRVRQRLRDETGKLGERPPGWNIQSLAYLAEQASALADVDVARALYEWFARHAGVVIASEVPGCPGSVDRYLGMLATVLGRWSDAEGHFESALRIEAGLRSPPFLARTRYWNAHLLIKRPDGDARRATELAATAEETARKLGMAALADDARRLLDRL